MTSNLKPVRAVALAAAIMLVVQVLCLLVAAVLAMMTLDAMPAVPQDPASAPALREVLVRRGWVEDVLFLSSIGYVPTGLAVIAWLWRVRDNAEVLGGADQRWGRPWAIVGWFVPVLNLWIPRQVVSDVWKASAPDRARVLVHLWWILWLLLYPFQAFSRAAGEPQSLDAMAGRLEFTVIESFTGAATAILAILVVRGITLDQMDHADHIARITAEPEPA